MPRRVRTRLPGHDSGGGGGVNAYNLLLSAREFADKTSDELLTLSDETTHTRFHRNLCVPPHYLAQRRELQEEAHRLVFDDLSVKQRLCALGSLTPEQFMTHWPRWLGLSASFLFKCDLWDVDIADSMQHV